MPISPRDTKILVPEAMEISVGESNASSSDARRPFPNPSETTDVLCQRALLCTWLGSLALLSSVPSRITNPEESLRLGGLPICSILG